MKKLSYCEKCKKEEDVIVNNVEYELEYDGKKIKYAGKKAVCVNCGNEVFLEEVEEFNQNAFENAYRDENNIITIHEIDEILKRYNIAKSDKGLLAILYLFNISSIS